VDRTVSPICRTGAKKLRVPRGALGSLGEAGIENQEELTPEKEADLYLERRRARAAKHG
jgi:hypothetical protein